MFTYEPAFSIVNDFEPACSLFNFEPVRSFVDWHIFKTSYQRIEQITITHLLIAPRIVLERQCCVIKTTDNSQLGQSGGRQYCLIAAFVLSKFDRRLFRSRVHLIETKGQFDPSKGFDRRVSDNKN